jgi:Fe2+ or Zn2+ uptake regulation protein
MSLPASLSLRTGLVPESPAHGTVAQRLAWAVGLCERSGLRLTATRRAVLGIFATERTPINLDAVAHAEGVRGRCDATTVYRTLVLLCEAGVLRQIHLRSKSSFFALNMPGEAHDHLICRRCGAVKCLPALASLDQLARELAAAYDFADVRHDLEFHGLCPACRKAVGNAPPVNKFAIRPARPAPHHATTKGRRIPASAQFKPKAMS